MYPGEHKAAGTWLHFGRRRATERKDQAAATQPGPRKRNQEVSRESDASVLGAYGTELSFPCCRLMPVLDFCPGGKTAHCRRASMGLWGPGEQRQVRSVDDPLRLTSPCPGIRGDASHVLSACARSKVRSGLKGTAKTMVTSKTDSCWIFRQRSIQINCSLRGQ